jgi:hypothetical protein
LASSLRLALSFHQDPEQERHAKDVGPDRWHNEFGIFNT